MIETLLNKGAKVDIADSRGRTPLHLAAANGHKEVVEALIKAKANVNIKDEDEKTPFDLATDDKIKTLLKEAAEKTDPVDGSSTDSEGGQEEADVTTTTSESGRPQAQQGATSTGEGTTEHPDPVGPSMPTRNNGSTNSAGQGTDVTTGSAQPVAPTEPAQTEEQPSSFFGSLFSILMKPFSLIASFFGGFFSWLFGSDEPIQSSSESDQTVVSEPPNNQVSDEPIQSSSESDQTVVSEPPNNQVDNKII